MSFSTRQKIDEFFRIWFTESQEGRWLALLDKPLSVTMPLEQQEQHLFKYAYLAECNDVFASMYGHPDPKDLIGTRFPQLLIVSDPANLKAVLAFLSSGYHIKNVQSHEVAINGEERYFLNDVRGVVEENHLVRFWGKQKDITSRNLRIFGTLTSQQEAILTQTIQGKTLKEIGHSLGISQKSVDTVRSRLKRKLGASSIPQLAVRAVQLGLFEDD